MFIKFLIYLCICVRNFLDEDATDLKSVVHGKILNMLVPFPLPHPDTCKDPGSGVICPLTNGASFHYKATLPVRSNYPSVSLNN